MRIKDQVGDSDDSLAELQRLEAAAAHNSLASSADLDSETLALRESWLALCDLLFEADERSAAHFAEPAMRPPQPANAPRRKDRQRAVGRWSGHALCGAALSVAALSLTALATLVWGPRSDSSPIDRTAIHRGAVAAEAAGDFRTAASDFRAAAHMPWVEELDEQIAQTGRFVSLLEYDAVASGADDDRALDSLLQRLDAMNIEASSGSL